MTDKSPIFFIIYGLPMGGAEKFLISLINFIQNKRGNTVLIMLGGETTLLHEVNNHVEKIHIEKKGKFDVGMIITLEKLYRKRNPQKVFCVNAYAFFIAKLAAIGKYDLHFYLSPHTTVPFSFKHDLLSRLFYSQHNKRDTVIFLCNYQMKYMHKKYGLNKGMSAVIYNGIDTKYNKPLSSKIHTDFTKQRYGIMQGEKIILNVARLSKEKGHEYAIEALSLLHNIYGFKAHMILVGDGDSILKNELTTMISQRNLDAFIHFAGKQQDVRPYYMSCDIFSLSSTSETFSLAALEAMAFGKPCVLTEVGGAREMIQSNQNGLLARAHDSASIARAWNHLLSRDPLDSKSIRSKTLQNYDIKNMLSAYSNLLNDNSYMKKLVKQ